MFRFYEEKQITEQYKKFRNSTPDFVARKVIQWMQERGNVQLDTVIDVGCGSGQNTLVFAPYFKQVRAFDISEEQIAEAKRHPAPDNVSFAVAPAELLPLPDHSAQLITGGCSFHWFDFETFYAEVDRILVPNGVVAAILVFPVPMIVHGTKSQELNQLTRELVEQNSDVVKHERVKKYCKNNYIDLPLPYADEKRIANLAVDIEKSLRFLLGILAEAKPEQLLFHPKQLPPYLDEFSNSFLKILNLDANTSPDEVPLTLHFNYSVVMCRKPGASSTQ